jgi:predicted aminopeptidase
MKKLSCMAGILLLSACETDLPSYLLKQGLKQGSLLLRAESVDTHLKNPHISPETQKYLLLSKEVLQFAEEKMQMKTGSNYRHYISLSRPWVTQIVMAAHKNKLTSHKFRYPIFGDLPYKGFFDEKDAIDLENKLRDMGLDTYRRPVEAFSSTGWLPDPLLSTMFTGELRFIELLLHELTHSTFYFKSEANFNEAFASWMGFKAALEFIEQSARFENKEKMKIELKNQHQRQIHVASLFQKIKQYGKTFYDDPNNANKREKYFEWIRATFREEKLHRLAELNWNNALILSFGTYYELVPQIEAYAQKENLSPAEFLKRIKTTGAKIIQDIRAEALDQKK